jgi:hypothetical protein
MLDRASGGARVPQPTVTTAQGPARLDDLLDGRFTMLTLDADLLGTLDGATEAAWNGLGGQMLLLAPGAIEQDEAGVLQSWFDAGNARWAILRPDRYVFAKGTTPAEAADALDLLFRQLHPEQKQANGRRHAEETVR